MFKGSMVFNTILIGMAFTGAAQAFCVYNATTGKDPNTGKPIVLDYFYQSRNTNQDITQVGHRYNISQHSRLCSKTNARGRDDFSLITPFLKGKNLPLCGSSPRSLWVKVANVGGYVIVSGSVINGVNQFSCEVRRDPE